MTDFWQRLKQRKIAQWAVAYVAAAFALLQGIDIIAQRFAWPDSIARALIIVSCVGFFITLLLAWYHGERGAQKISGAELLLLSLVLAIGGGLLLKFSATGPALDTATAPVLHTDQAAMETASPASSADEKSVAVLPFVNMSKDKDNEYFSDGISEEILNVLARMPALRVAARTSSFSFKDKATEIPEIAQQLNVRMVLEGSVRKQGDRVRITAQLIDASNGFHVWSQTYDRELKDIFAIQDEIATAIANELNVRLNAGSGGDKVSGTTDLKAYDHYLKGIGLWQARGDQNLRDAVTEFRAALALDPDYAKAWAGLAITYAVLPEWTSASLAAANSAGRDAAEHAIALDGSLPEPYAALGYIASNESRYPTSRAMFRRAIGLAPSYATGYQWSGETLAGEGQVDEALKMLRMAAELDPKSAIVGSVVAATLITAGHDDEGLAYCDSIVGVIRDWCPLLQFGVAMSRKDYVKARTVLEPAASARGPEALRLFHAQMDALYGKGDVDNIALQLLDLPDGQSDPNGLTPMATSELLYWFMAIGRSDLAIERFARYAKVVPYVARQIGYDKHYAALHCEPRFVDVLRSINVKEPDLAQACPKDAAP